MLTIAPANGHRESGDARDADPQRLACANDVRPSPEVLPPVVFNDCERRSLELLGDDMRETIAAAVSTVVALTGDNRDAARLEVIAKGIACERARQLELARLLDAVTCSRRRKTMVVIDRLLTNSNRRLCALLAEHRASCSNGARAAVLVAHADYVRVQAGE